MLNLPIERYRRELVDTVFRGGDEIQDRTTILLGRPGVGKTIGSSIILLEETDEDFIVTQPTRMASMTIPQRVAELRGCELGTEVGYQHAGERKDSRRTRCLFRTDGIEFLESLKRRKSRFRTVIIDEAHKFNLNIEFLLALLRDDPELRIVISSATLDAEDLSIYFGGAAILEISGTMFPIEDRPPGPLVEEDLFQLLRERSRVLAFEAGEQQIYERIRLVRDYLRECRFDADILPLHASLPQNDVARCLQHFRRPTLIVATDYAETSVTLAINTVYDSEVHHRREVRDGVTGLFARWTSLAQRDQRRGRAGRTEPGVYVGRCPLPFAERERFPVPEVQRSRLDEVELRLRSVGKSIRGMNLVHPPPGELVTLAESSLQVHGCTQQSGGITDLGRKVSALPITVPHARLVLAAHELGVLDDGVIAAALLEQGGILPKEREPELAFVVPADPDSELLYQLAVYKYAIGLETPELKSLGLSSRTLRRTTELIEQIHRALSRYPSIKRGSTGDREALRRAIATGLIESVYRYDGERFLFGTSQRGFPLSSSITLQAGDWVVGEPFDRNVMDESGAPGKLLRTLLFPSKIEVSWLSEIAPHLITRGSLDAPRYDVSTDRIVADRVVRFRGEVVDREPCDMTGTPEAPDLFADWLASLVMRPIRTAPPGRDRRRQEASCSVSIPAIGEMADDLRDRGLKLQRSLTAMATQIQRVSTLNHLAGRTAFEPWSQQTLASFLRERLKGAAGVQHVTEPERLVLPPLDGALVKAIENINPASIEIRGRRVQVGYPTGKPPRVQVSDWWPLLPDEGVQLPDGRTVEFEIFGFLGPSGDVRALKAEAVRVYPGDLARFARSDESANPRG